ncbi:MAG: hypothetical protein NVSMB2_11490 [Chloroflexota bacterium]
MRDLRQTTAGDAQHSVVIGGGLAGLAAATYLGRAGRRVTVVERGLKTGGRATTDTPHGFALNRGAHALYTGGPASEVLTELGITYSAGIPRSVSALDARGMHRFPAGPLALMRTSLLSTGEKWELLRLFVRVRSLNAASLADECVADWIARNTSAPRIRALLTATARVSLYSAALDLASADAFVHRLQQNMKHPIHYVDGGWQTLVDALERAARSANVVLRMSAPVERVEIRDVQAVGVRLHRLCRARAFPRSYSAWLARGRR